MGFFGDVRKFFAKIGPAIQGNNYGTGTRVGGKTVKKTGSTRTRGGSTPKRGGSGGGSRPPSVVGVPHRHGGGGSSGGGGGGRVQGPTRADLEERRRNEEALRRLKESIQRARDKKEASRQEKIASGRVTGQLNKKNNKDINILQSGKIQVGKNKFTGGAVVPGSGGKTANEINRLALKKAQIQFPGVRRGGFFGTFQAQTQKQEEVIIKDKNQTGIKDPFLSTVSAVKRPTSFIGGLGFDTSQRISLLQTKGARGEITSLERAELLGTSFVFDVGMVPLGLFKFGKSLVTQPITTVKNIPGGFVQQAKELGVGLRSNTPEVAVAEIGTEIFVYKGLGKISKLFLKGSDIIRTARLKELPTEEIVAKEFFEGQTFPTIKKGQTAGQLLQEFKPTLLGETKAGGFTATTKPFKSSTKAKEGFAEFPGLYQAPKVSPRFLRISGESEKKLFSFKIFDTFRPSVVRTTPTGFELIPGVSKAQKGLASIGKAKKFFMEQPEKGKSFIPFIKTEKEAVIPAGTNLEKIDTRFFFKFEGRRVPIQEFKTIGEVGKEIKIKEPKVFLTEDISRVSSGGRIRSAGTINPLTSSSFVSPIFKSSIRKIPSTSSSRIISSGRKISSSLESPLTDVSKINLISNNFPTFGGSPGDIPSRGRLLPPGEPGILPPINPANPPINPPSEKPKRRRRKGTAERKKKKIKKKTSKKRKTPIRPSFSAIVGDFEGKLPKIKFIGKTEIGILPTEIRRIPKRKKIKRAKQIISITKNKKRKGIFNLPFVDF